MSAARKDSEIGTDTNPPGVAIVENGILIRDGGGFALRRDTGGTIALDLHRVPVDHVEKRVRIAGIWAAAGLLDVETIGPG